MNTLRLTRRAGREVSNPGAPGRRVARLACQAVFLTSGSDTGCKQPVPPAALLYGVPWPRRSRPCAAHGPGRGLGALVLPGVVCFVLLAGPVCWAQAPDTAPAAENLLAGAKWQYSSDDGATWSDQPPVVRQGAAAVIRAKTTFPCGDPAGLVVLEFAHGLPRHDAMELTLNATPITSGLKGMVYKTYPAIPAGLLKKGANDLAAAITFEKVPPPAEPDQKDPDVVVALKGRLTPLRAEDLAIITGPILGAAGEEFFTVTCRTNMPVPVTLKVTPAAGGSAKPIEKKSRPGLFHRFRIDGLDGKVQWQYSLSVDAPPYRLAGKSYPVRLLPKGAVLRFIALGDCRTRTKEWASVAEAVCKAKPEFVVFTGDMTECGRFDWLWQEHFFGPAAEMFATIPFYAVIGNHEENAAVYPLYFHTPTADGEGKDWSQQVGPALLVGFDGQWSQDWEREKRPWLRKALEGSPAKFIFAFTHYPGWSSAKNGSLDPKTNLPKHWAYRNVREFVAPLLARQHAAAIIVSHEHMYERSDLPGGVMQIISGGAGAPVSRITPEAKQQNPYSKVVSSALHYCLIQIKGDQATFTALTLDGNEIDRCTWPARPKE